MIRVKLIVLWVMMLLVSFLPISAQLDPADEYYLVEVSPDETKVAAVARLNGNLHIFDAVSGDLLLDISSIPLPPLAIAWGPASNRVATAGGSSTIRVWCADTSQTPSCVSGELIAEITGHRDPIVAIAWSNDDRLVSSGQLETFGLRTWDMVDYSQLAAIPLGNEAQLAWHPNNQEIASAGIGGTYLINDNLTLDAGNDYIGNQFLEPVDVHKLSVAWSSNGMLLASGGDDGKIDIYDYPGETLQQTLNGNESTVYALAWSPDDRYLASNSGDGTVWIWDWQAGESTTIAAPKNLAVNTQIDWTATTGLIFPDESGIVGLGPNQSPSANAGVDQQIADTDGDGIASITLDGSGSSDDVMITEFQWYQDEVLVATGSTPTINLPVGTHTISLTITDDDGATASDTVTVSVIE